MIVSIHNRRHCLIGPGRVGESEQKPDNHKQNKEFDEIEGDGTI